ncbi:YciI family protein [Antribacter gilvus]|uniref:YciI family protein n=1 Tax=Antribacter gilvus TaxID=2304675 RepID=UPI000F777031|nr:YciI family protein [Antribacter gilvus]
MTEYVVLLPGNEQPWLDATDEERAAVYGKHTQFSRALAERGHKITGGAELAPSSQAKVVRADGSVTDGPYAESVEQLTGFYVVDTDDLDDLLQICALIAGSAGVEVRECLRGDPSDGAASTDDAAAATR